MKHNAFDRLSLLLILTFTLALANPAIAQENQPPQAKLKYRIGKSVKPAPQTSPLQRPKDWSIETTKMEAKLDSRFSQLKAQNADKSAYMKTYNDIMKESFDKNQGRLTDLKKLKDKAGVSGLEMTGTPPETSGYGGLLSDAEHVNVGSKKFDNIAKTAKKMGYTTEVLGDRLYIKELDAEFYRGASKYKSLPGSSARELETAAKLLDKEYSGGMKVVYDKTGKPLIKDGKVVTKTWDKHLYSKDLAKKGGKYLTMNVKEFGKEEWRGIGKLTSRMMKNGGITDKDILDKCEKLKQRVPPEALGIITQEDRKEFMKKVIKYNKQAYQNTKVNYKTKFNKLNHSVKNAKRILSGAIKGGNKGAINKAREAFYKAKTELFDYTTQHHYANKGITRHSGTDVLQMVEGTTPKIKVKISPNGRKFYINSQTGEIIPKSKVKEMLLKNSKTKVIRSSGAGSSIKTKALGALDKGFTALNYAFLFHQFYKGVQQGAQRATEDVQPEDSDAKILAKIVAYEVAYGIGLGQSWEMGYQAGEESWYQYYLEEAQGKNPSKVWAMGRGMAWGMDRFLEQWCNIDALVKGYEDFEGLQVDMKMLSLAEKQALQMEALVRYRKTEKEIEEMLKELKVILGEEMGPLTEEQKAMLEHDRKQVAWEAAVEAGLLGNDQYGEFERGYNPITGQYDPLLAAERPPLPSKLEKPEEPSEEDRINMFDMLRCEVSKNVDAKDHDNVKYKYNFDVAFKEGGVDKYRLISSGATLYREPSRSAPGSTIGLKDMEWYTLDNLMDIVYRGHEIAPVLNIEIKAPDGTLWSQHNYALGWKALQYAVDTSFSHPFTGQKGQIQRQRKDIAGLTKGTEKQMKDLDDWWQNKKKERTYSRQLSLENLEHEIKACFDGTASPMVMHNLGNLEAEKWEMTEKTIIDPDTGKMKRVRSEGLVIVAGYSGDQYKDDPHGTCSRAKDIKKWMSGRNIDFSRLDREYASRKKKILQDRDKWLSELNSKKLGSQEKLQQIAHKATSAYQDFLAQNTETTVEKSRNFGFLDEDYTIFKSNLHNFGNSETYTFGFEVAFFPAQPLWSEEIPQPLAYLSAGGKVVPITSQEDAFTVTITEADSGQTLEAYRVPIIDEHFLRFHDIETKKWTDKMHKLNKRIGEFINEFGDAGADCSAESQRKIQKNLQKIKDMFLPVEVGACAVYFDGFGLLSEYEDTIQFTRTKLGENSLAALQKIEVKWEELFEKAGGIFYKYSTKVDMEQHQCNLANQPDLNKVLAALNAVTDKPGSSKSSSSSRPHQTGKYGSRDTSPFKKGSKDFLYGDGGTFEGWSKNKDTEIDNNLRELKDKYARGPDTSEQPTASSVRPDTQPSAPGTRSQKPSVTPQDPNGDLQKILDDINREAKRALGAMDFDYDCAERVKSHLVNLAFLLNKMTTILSSIDTTKDLKPDLKNTLLSWSKDNITSTGNLITKAEEVKKMDVPEMTGNLPSKYQERLRKQQQQMINMKKTYQICTPVFEENYAKFVKINKLLGGDGKPQQTKATDEYDDTEKKILEDTKRELRDLEKEYEDSERELR